MQVTRYRIEGLGHLSTLIADEAAGLAVVVDPRRDVDVYLADAARDELRITHVIETHLHNDYVSGARDLAALTGAEHVIGAGAELQHEYRPIHHGDTFDVGELRFTALDTPGHTPEHVSYELADTSRASEPVALLTGGSLLVGAVGRTDLLGAANAVPYAHAMHHSLHDVLLPHEDFVGVYPTHGAGSLCSTGISAAASSTIGYERRYDPLLSLEIDAFARALLDGQPAFPPYFARMRPINQAGPPLIGGRVPEIEALSLEAFDMWLGRGAFILDARPPEAHAAGHVIGSLSVPAGPSFGTWLGWMVPAGRASCSSSRTGRARRPRPAGAAHRLRWPRRARPVASRPGGAPAGRWPRVAASSSPALARALDADPAERPFVIDVRQASEYAEGHVPGSHHLFAGDLADGWPRCPRPADRVHLRLGYRSSVCRLAAPARGLRGRLVGRRRHPGLGARRLPGGPGRAPGWSRRRRRRPRPPGSPNRAGTPSRPRSRTARAPRPPAGRCRGR